MVAHLVIAHSTGDILELRASKTFKERVLSLFNRAPSVRRPGPQHEEEVREPGGLAGKTEQNHSHLVYREELSYQEGLGCN